MTKKSLTKTCALMLLAVFAAVWSSNAWASVTINVKASSAPYIYAWDDNQTPITGSFPGDVMTDTKVVNGVTYYTRTFEENSINLLFATNSSTKSVDFNGITGEVFFNYNGGTQAYGIIPNDVKYESSGFYAYFVNTDNWDNVYAYIFGDGDYASWPGTPMTYVGTDGTGKNVYKFGPVSSANNYTKIIFTNNAGTQTSDLDFYNGGYYYRYVAGTDCVATIDANRITNTDTYFADSHFREAITKSIGVAEGAAFNPTDYTVLDLSYDSESMTGKINTINTPSGKGIDYFTNLKELYLNDNDLTYLLLTKNTQLEVLEMRNNTQMVGFSANTATATAHTINMPPKTTPAPLKRFDATGCTSFGWFQAINGTYGINTLEWLSLNSCPLNGWSTGISAQTGLKYLDLTNSGQTSSITVAALTELDTLIVADNPSIGSSYMNMTHCTKLKYFDLTNTGMTTDNAKTTLNTSALSNLETLKISGNPSMRYAYTEKLSNLKYFEIANGDLYFTSTYQLSTLTPANNPNLEYLDISNDLISSSVNPIDGFQNLKTVIANNNPQMPRLTINNCPAIETIDISNNTVETILSITNSNLTVLPTITGLSTATALTKIDLTGNAFTAVPEVGGNINIMVMNSNLLTDIVAPSNIQYLYAQNNNFGSGAYTLPQTSLVGLDLGNNGFTKFKAENNTSLKSLALAGNTGLTEIELHGNTALTQTSPDGIIESDNGLYIKGLSSLQTLNIENSSFSRLGQQNSLQGVTGLKTLKARHNEFTTFTNGVYALDVAGHGNYRKPDNTESSLEYLTALEYLDLAYNNLQDSVHLYKNVNLKHLDVSHNNHITGVYDGTITKNDVAEQNAMRTKKAKRLVKYGMYYGDKGELTDALYAQACAVQNPREVPFDIRYEDLNDTTGLYHLDLQKNLELEWIDISYTNIHNTAAGPGVMNPGWMSADWVGDSNEALAATVKNNTTTSRSHSAFHTFVYFAPCSKLKTIHMDHCNLQSLGISYFPELDTLTASYMYGDCYFMRDATPTNLRYGMANTGPSRVRKYLSPKTNSETGIQDAVNVVGPDGTANSYYDNHIKYYDISYSGFNELRFNYGINLEYIDVSGNPLKCHVHPNSDNSYYNSLDVTYCPNIRTVLAENCSDLPIVRAHNRTKLDTLYLSNDPNLKTLYVQNDPLLKTNFHGLNTLTGLETLFGYNNTHWGNDITFASNTALKNLWISNINASQLNVAANTALEKLRAYDNSLTALDVSGNANLLWLDVARNKLSSIDLSGNTALQFFNISNGTDTRTQLDGTEQLNHDGSDGDGIKPTTVYSDSETPVQSADAGNSLSDLALPASIIDARANGNDLHSISGNFSNLTNIEFAHNHINGIDLSAAPGATIESRDNGRTILADCAKFLKKENGVVQEYTVYFFQLDPNVTGNGTVLTLKDSEDLKGDTRRLGTDGMVMDNITWDGTSGSALKNTITPDDMSVLDPDEVPGNIVVLNPTSESGNGAEGTATYTYKTSENSTSEFYLNWSSDGTITGISEIKAEGGVSITNTYGNLTVAGADGAVVGVYDLNGRQVASETITGGKALIDGLAPGIYLVNGQKVLVK